MFKYKLFKRIAEFNRMFSGASFAFRAERFGQKAKEAARAYTDRMVEQSFEEVVKAMALTESAMAWEEDARADYEEDRDFFYRKLREIEHEVI